MGCSALLEHRLLGKQGGSARALLLADTKGFGRCTSTGPGTGNCWASLCCLVAAETNRRLPPVWAPAASWHTMICCGEQAAAARSQPDPSAALQALSVPEMKKLLLLCRLCVVSTPHTIAALRGVSRLLGSSSLLLPCRLCQGVRASKMRSPATAALHHLCQGFNTSHCCCHAGGARCQGHNNTQQRTCLPPSKKMGQGLQMACNALKHRNLLFAPATVCAALQVHCTRASRWDAQAMITPRLPKHKQNGAALQTVPEPQMWVSSE